MLAPDRPSGPIPLFAALPHRRTTRLAFDLEKPVTRPHARAADRGGRSVGVRLRCHRPAPVAALRTLAPDGARRAERAGAWRAEEARWLRLGADEIAAAQRRHPGARRSIALGRAHWGCSRPRQLADPDAAAARMARLLWDNLFAATASFGWLATADDGLRERLEPAAPTSASTWLPPRWASPSTRSARRWETSPSWPTRRLELERLLGVAPPPRVQMLFRLGHAGPQPPHPRRHYHAVIEQQSNIDELYLSSDCKLIVATPWSTSLRLQHRLISG